MARIAGINIPQNKLVHIGLTYIYGIGDKFSQQICSSLEIPRAKRVNELTDEEILKIREYIDQNFKVDVLEAQEPVLVDFWAEWCGPCKAIAPSLEELSEEMSNKLKVVKINVDENPSTSQAYSIRSIPALMIFKDGEKISEKMGALPKSALESWIKDTI